MNTALWVAQTAAALVFLTTGGVKLLVSRERLQRRLPRVVNAPVVAIKALGLAEVLGAVGLVAPGLVGVMPVLTPVAAVALFILMIGATVIHLRHRESPKAAVGVGLLTLFIAVGRFAVAP